MKTFFSKKVQQFGLLLLCLFCFSFDIKANIPIKPLSEYKRVIWNNEKGLPQNSVMAMKQTRDGYLWFGTQEGLARFNGISFKVFDTTTTPKLASNHVTSILEDSTGRLWIGTLQGLNLYENGEMRVYKTENGLSGNSIISLYEDGQGNLWIGTSSGGLNRFKNGQIQSFGESDGLSAKRIRAIGEDADGSIWIGTSEGLFKYKNGAFELYRDESEVSGPVRTIHRDSRNVLWIGMENGLAKLQNGRFVNDKRFAGKVVRSVSSDKESNLWIGGEFGLSRVYENEITTIEGGKGMPVGGTYCSLVDNEGSLWFSTEGDGLYQLVNSKFSAYTAAENLSGNIADSITQSASGDVWVSTENGINRFRGNTFDLILRVGAGLPNNRITSLLGDDEDGLWIGTSKGLLRWQNNRLINFNGSEKLANKTILALYRDPENNLWVGTGGGIYRIKTNSEGTDVIDYGQFNQVAATNVFVIAGSLSKTLWIGTSKGLFSLKDNQITEFTPQNGLPRGTVLSLYEDENDVLWIGIYDNGISRLKDGKFTTVGTKDGLFHSTVYVMMPDESGNLWMTSNRAIFRVSKKNLNDFMDGGVEKVDSVVYGTADGMKSSECNGGFQPAGLKAQNGEMWFPTTKGVAIANPSRMPFNSLPPPIYIENVVADTVQVAPDEKASLAAGTQRIGFDFAVLSYIAPEKVKIRYRLDGYDKDWTEARTSREAFYTNLPPGDYTFRVIASNNDGIWNETGASFQLHIKPYFYQTWWFILVCMLLVGGTITLIHFGRIRQLQLRHEATLKERTRIARELHDTLLQGFVGVSSQLSVVAAQFQNSPEIAERHLDVARKMIRYSVNEARRAVQNLRSNELLEKDFVSLLSEAVNRLTEAQPLQVNYKVEGTPFEFSSMIKHQILRIAEEAVTNAVKHSKATSLEIALKYDAPNIRLEVTDNGQGFEIKNPFSKLNGHFGLLGMNERAEKIGGALLIESTPGFGTKINFAADLSAVSENQL